MAGYFKYLNRGSKIRPIEDPRGILGGVNRAALVGPWTASLRCRRRHATRRHVLDLGLDGVTEMDWLVNIEKKTPREAAHIWMTANDDRVAAWLKA